MNEITKSAETRQALRWLSGQLAWERVLAGLRGDDTSSAIGAQAA